MRTGNSNVYRATSSLAARQPATSGFARHVINATTSLPVDRHRDVDSKSGPPDNDDDDDDDYHNEMMSFGSGYDDDDDDDNDDAVRDYHDLASVKPRRHGSTHDVWSPGSPSLPSSSSSSSSSLSLSRPAVRDDSERRVDPDERASDTRVKDISRTLSTTPGARPLLRDVAASATRRGFIEQRRPMSVVTSSSSAARRRHYVDDDSLNNAAHKSLLRPVHYLLLFFHSLVAAILFSSAHVFRSLPVIGALAC